MMVNETKMLDLLIHQTKLNYEIMLPYLEAINDFVINHFEDGEIIHDHDPTKTVDLVGHYSHVQYSDSIELTFGFELSKMTKEQNISLVAQVHHDTVNYSKYSKAIKGVEGVMFLKGNKDYQHTYYYEKPFVEFLDDRLLIEQICEWLEDKMDSIHSIIEIIESNE